MKRSNCKNQEEKLKYKDGSDERTTSRNKKYNAEKQNKNQTNNRKKLYKRNEIYKKSLGI